MRKQPVVRRQHDEMLSQLLTMITHQVQLVDGLAAVEGPAVTHRMNDSLASLLALYLTLLTVCTIASVLHCSAAQS